MKNMELSIYQLYDDMTHHTQKNWKQYRQKPTDNCNSILYDFSISLDKAWYMPISRMGN
jgi:hypothetical protein